MTLGTLRRRDDARRAVMRDASLSASMVPVRAKRSALSRGRADGVNVEAFRMALALQPPSPVGEHVHASAVVDGVKQFEMLSVKTLCMHQ